MYVVVLPLCYNRKAPERFQGKSNTHVISASIACFFVFLFFTIYIICRVSFFKINVLGAITLIKIEILIFLVLSLYFLKIYFYLV
jgi:hypothetical protein